MFDIYNKIWTMLHAVTVYFYIWDTIHSDMILLGKLIVPLVINLIINYQLSNYNDYIRLDRLSQCHRSISIFSAPF